MRELTREEVSAIDENYKEILDTETHHNHKIIEDEQGTIRWESNKEVRRWIDKIGLNDIVGLLYNLGCDKNSELYRKMYRDIGYSLSGYGDIFYWELNNPDVDDYKPNAK